MWWRSAAAMLMAPARRRIVMARFRRLTMTRGGGDVAGDGTAKNPRDRGLAPDRASAGK